MDENDKVHLRKAAIALDRVLHNEAGLHEHVRQGIEKRKAKREKMGRLSSAVKNSEDDNGR